MAQQVDPERWSTPYLVTKTLRRDPYPAISPYNPANSQKDKIIIITGASSGIGEAAAKVWARARAKGIVIAARRLDALNEVAEELKSISPTTQVLAVKTDIVVESDVKSLFDRVQETFGRAADVLLNNAGYLKDGAIAETPADEWWTGIEINLKGPYLMSQYFIQSQPNPKESTATIITVSSGRAGFTSARGSAYNISKIAEQRLNEHIQVEHPNLRVFTTMPGVTLTSMVSEAFAPFAKDHIDLTGMLALYLVQPRADYLKGSMVGVNWDVDELEQHKEEILEKKVLQTSWLPILPFCGGKGLGA
ncbi:uncharacterized protein L3040_000031 [Drepanopeziza brunnea f. sp. 'multigermtubi']|uniref:Putative short-chain dehydrogenase/reductase n=1 Tax=Marssonina brunnea f. sp. multigermtubi (strain MB_m1) TaxID=1072389 RepID=K1WB21_MARBU|nr:putative short-chain dehydrogenase/reductase [Drepanopeziza brunnea f. sp. 'multigermtubi' MB_m1]EKD14500.1 putative short-chain dehydrogenase/reductase [Drepanopeziza brunnea f. sp. 'multigermtubi' MB_m1]KAJ5053740.1 hypothetical protein L3040_000031 [Drepanopeziza brunnea f. sp. 'multigermtubi']